MRPAAEWRQAIIAEARTWKGTPHVHGQACKGRAVDCANLIMQPAIAEGIDLERITGYSSRPSRNEMQHRLRDQLVLIDKRQAIEADVLCMVFGQGLGERSTHLAYLTARRTVIHAYLNPHSRVLSKVVEHDFDERWFRRTVSAWRFREFC